MAAKRFVVLDRDGTIIVERHYLADPAQVQLLPGAAQGLRKLSALGLGTAVVTNQSAIGRGYFDLPRLDQIHRRLAELLAAEAARRRRCIAAPIGRKTTAAAASRGPGWWSKRPGSWASRPRRVL